MSLSSDPTPVLAPRRPLRRWRYVLAAAAVIGFAALAWYGIRRALAPAPPPLPEEIRDEAVVQALREARQAVLDDPYSGPAWGRLAEVLLAHGYLTQAEPCLEQAERRDPAEPAWPYLLAVQRLPHDRADAERHLRRAVERVEADEAADPSPLLLLAEMQLERGATEEAEQLCQAVLARRPSDAHALLLLGSAAAARDDLAGALELLARSAAAHPAARRPAYTQMAAVHGRLGDEEAAREFARRALTLPPPSWPDPFMARLRGLKRGVLAQQQQAEQYKAQHRPEERIRTLEALVAQTTDARAPVDLAQALIERGDRDGAVRALQEAIRRQPDRFNAHLLLAITLFEQAEQLRQAPATAAQAPEKYAAAAEAARTAARLQPGRAPAHYFLGRSLRRLGQYPAAAEALRQAVRLRPQEIAFRLELAEALAQDGQTSAAIAQLEEARSFAGDNPRLRHLLTQLRRPDGPP